MSDEIKCSLTPIRDRLIVQPVEADPKTHSPSKFIVSTAAIDKMKRGRVVAAGEGFLSPAGVPVALSTKIGDVVVYDDGAGRPIYSYGKQYVILREQEVLAIESQP